MRLPLALNIAAARIATNPHLPIDLFVQELREAGDTLTTHVIPRWHGDGLNLTWHCPRASASELETVLEQISARHQQSPRQHPHSRPDRPDRL